MAFNLCLEPPTKRLAIASIAGLVLTAMANLTGAAAAVDLSNYGVPTPAPISVFFESDRRLNSDGIHFGDQINEPLDYTNLGSVSVPPGMVRKLVSAGFNATDKVSRFADFAQMAEAVRAQSSGKKIVIFVHGCCTNFPLSTAQAASLAEHSGATVVMYDWGSPLLSYGGSLSTYPRSQERFNKFMLNMARA